MFAVFNGDNAVLLYIDIVESHRPRQGDEQRRFSAQLQQSCSSIYAGGDCVELFFEKVFA